MFKKAPEPPRAVTNGAPKRPINGEQALSIIGPGMRVVGEVITEGTVRVEGTVEGTVSAGQTVIVGRDGEVIGDVVTHEAVIGGRVTGSVTAETRLELQSTCIIDGEIRARAQHLQLAEGARFSGRVHMIDEGEEQPIRALPAETRGYDEEDEDVDESVDSPQAEAFS